MKRVIFAVMCTCLSLGAMDKFGELAQADQQEEMIAIDGIEKRELLIALWHAAKADAKKEEALVIMRNAYSIEHALEAEVAALKIKELSFLAGRKLFVDVSGKTFDAEFYNEANGAGLAQRVVAELRAKAGNTKKPSTKA